MDIFAHIIDQDRPGTAACSGVFLYGAAGHIAPKIEYKWIDVRKEVIAE